MKERGEQREREVQLSDITFRHQWKLEEVQAKVAEWQARNAATNTWPAGH